MYVYCDEKHWVNTVWCQSMLGTVSEMQLISKPAHISWWLSWFPSMWQNSHKTACRFLWNPFCFSLFQTLFNLFCLICYWCPFCSVPFWGLAATLPAFSFPCRCMKGWRGVLYLSQVLHVCKGKGREFPEQSHTAKWKLCRRKLVLFYWNTTCSYTYFIVACLKYYLMCLLSESFHSSSACIISGCGQREDHFIVCQ